ncbi:MAG: hypothetical protein ACLPSF_08240 [Methylocella sp.]
MRRSTLSLAVAVLAGAPVLAVAQAIPPNAPTRPSIILNRNGGFAGTGFGVGRAGAGSTSTVAQPPTSATPVSHARSAAMISGYAHIGAGTGGLGLGMGNAIGGLRDTAIGSGVGGRDDLTSFGTGTGGVIGAGTGLNAPSGGIKDAFNQGIATGGVQSSAIGAGVGGLNDLNSFGASTGGAKEGDNAPRYRVVQ